MTDVFQDRTRFDPFQIKAAVQAAVDQVDHSVGDCVSPVGLKPTTNGRVKTSHPERVF